MLVMSVTIGCQQFLVVVFFSFVPSRRLRALRFDWAPVDAAMEAAADRRCEREASVGAAAHANGPPHHHHGPLANRSKWFAM